VLLVFLSWLVGMGMKVPTVFFYSSTRMILAAMTTLVLTIVLGPWCIRKLYEMKTGQSIRVDAVPLLAELHKKKKDTPTMGGILMLGSMLVAMALWMDFGSAFTLILAVTTIWLGGIGAWDDILKQKYKNSKGLSARKKFIGQVVLAGAIGLYLVWPSMQQAVQDGKWFAPPTAKQQVLQIADGELIAENTTYTTQEYAGRYYVPFYKDPLFILSGAGLIFAVFITIFVVTGTSNAVNLTDGLDGLASGCLVMVAVVLACVAFLSNNIEISRYLNILYIEGSGEIAIYLCALIGACLGFLWYNGHPAQVFMGDIGSLALGGIIGVVAVLLRREVMLALAGGIFVAEALSVILQVGSYKLRGKKRIFLCTPLHHHFEYKGWPETKVVLRFWIIAFILGMIGLASLKFQ
jgi:phospho-N-acetylmuramoyl-pentapeptide-transferase